MPLPSTTDPRGAAAAILASLGGAPDPGDLADAYDRHVAGTGRRRRQGAYATPRTLAERMLDVALDPLIARTARAPDARAALLGLRVLDPACGGGRFLVAAGERIARALEAHGGDPARAEVAARCLHGVDLDPVAVEVTRSALAAWSGAPEHACGRLVTGDALLGAPPVLVDGIPGEAFAPADGDDPGAAAALRRRNRGERIPAGPAGPWASDAWCAAFLLPKLPGRAVPTTADLAVARDGSVRRAVRRVAARRRPVHWHLAFPGVARPDGGGFDLVIGNPPFLGRLRRRTAPDPRAARLLAARMGDAARGYADAAAQFLATALELARPGGRVALVLPLSVLSSRDAGPARRRAAEGAAMEWLWVGPEGLFDADVRVLAVSLHVGGPRHARIVREGGAAFTRLEPVDADMDALAGAAGWAPLAGAALGVPRVSTSAAGRLGDIAHATAGFRQHHYELAPFVVDDAPGREGLPPLVTCGLIDPGHLAWGERPARHAGRVLDAPRVDTAGLRGVATLAAWARAQLVPKVVVATQTRVIEAAVDAAGAWLPATPVISVTPAPADLWRVAAVLLSPPATALALARTAGAALSADAIKLSARQVLDLPLPAARGPWEEAASVLQASHGGTGRARRAALARAAMLMCAAYGVEDAGALARWWEARLPGPRGD